ncbi:MAG: adhesin transport system membrane fusion protein [Saprospiraceae bacterium]|jgi:adhesin transport system membrane fusion protein
MLNITENSISDFISLEEFKSYKLLRKGHIRRISFLLATGLIFSLIICLFLPWTQNINAKGYVTTRSPEQRPQAIQSVIAGRLENWFVQEGDFVEKGDTVVFISEVKSEYFDPDLLMRTAEQVEAKSQSIESYRQKVIALQNQYAALNESLKLKREQTFNKILQARNKISMDSIDLVAFKTNLEIAKNQLSRTQQLYDKGLKTLTELQGKELKIQSDNAKVSVQENKLSNQKNVLTNLTIELLAIDNEYADKLAKSQSDQQSALSDKLESMAATSKLRNQFSNYTERQKFYFITAPQSGYITKTIKKGIGETIKEGTDIAIIMPSKYDLAIEAYMKPQDLPLLSIGNNVRLRFDGWPAIVISGWPESSTGVFSGDIVAIDQFISDNGFYRILISPDKTEKDWPEELRVGTGVSAFILLNEVPIWYEVWRQLNGFPPDFYQKEKEKEESIKRKAPIKSVK